MKERFWKELQTIRVEFDERRIAWVSFAGPEKRNAMNPADSRAAGLSAFLDERSYRPGLEPAPRGDDAP
jgi:hypothetical protein